MKSQTLFNSRLNSKDRSDEERLRIKESSLERQEFMRTLRLTARESELYHHRENYEKTLHESRWKEHCDKLKRQQKAEEIRKKKEELMLGKVK